jgi:XRE family transcriptional regulator, regulator of sulfur utilization
VVAVIRLRQTLCGCNSQLTTLHKQFGERVRQIRDDLDKSQEQFAEMIGMSVDFLSLIERGRNAPSFKKLERMARGLGKPVSFLFAFEAPTDRTKRNRR